MKTNCYFDKLNLDIFSDRFNRLEITLEGKGLVVNMSTLARRTKSEWT